MKKLDYKDVDYVVCEVFNLLPHKLAAVNSENKLAKSAYIRLANRYVEGSTYAQISNMVGSRLSAQEMDLFCERAMEMNPTFEAKVKRCSSMLQNIRERGYQDYE